MAPLELNPSFWRGRRVFVTGHTGFKGSWLALWLARLEAAVTGYAVGVPTSPSLYEIAGVAEEIDDVTGDVRDLKALAAAMHVARPEIVFHLAAQSLVRPSFDDPVGTFTTNVLGTVNALEAARGIEGLRTIVVVTSDKCYRRSDAPHSEEDPLGGDDPYSASKAAAELVVDAYRRSFFFDTGPAIASVRAGNVIGGGDWAHDRIVPDVMRAALEDGTAVVRNPEHVRPWQHVLDPLSGYLALAERLGEDRSLATAWNFGPPEDAARPVRWLVGALAERWPSPISVTLGGGDADGVEAPSLRLDSSRARERLGWSSAWPLEQALDATVDWYRSFAGGGDVRNVALAQIEQYEREGRR